MVPLLRLCLEIGVFFLPELFVSLYELASYGGEFLVTELGFVEFFKQEVVFACIERGGMLSFLHKIEQDGEVVFELVGELFSFFLE